MIGVRMNHVNFLSEIMLLMDFQSYIITASLCFVAFVAAGTKAPVLPWRVRYKVAVGTAKALDYLHHGTSRPVIHRDVKSSNILLNADFESQVFS